MIWRKGGMTPAYALLVGLAFVVPARAMDGGPDVPKAVTNQSVVPPDLPHFTAAIDSTIAAMASLPDVMNEVSRIDTALFSSLLKGLAIEPKMFMADSTGHEPAALGMSYSYQRTLALQEVGLHANPLDVGFDISAHGTVAFSQALNPSDFLRSGLSLGARQFCTRLNKSINSDSAAAAYQKLIVAAANGDESAEWQDAQNRTIRGLGTDVFWSLAGSAALESDQAFITKQWAYGAEGALAIRSWNHNQFVELFDLPFAIARVLTGVTKTLAPTGRAFPTIVAGVEQVDPKDNKERAQLPGGAAKFTRVRFELETRSSIAHVGDDDLYANLDWRVYQELGADDAVKKAGQDVFSYFVATLSLPSGWLASYAQGRLPFDARDSARWELGWHFNLGK